MRRYYNPELSEEEVRQLDRVNFIVLMSGQALLGSITPNLKAVLVETESEESITLHFVLRQETAFDRAEIGEVVDSLTDLLLAMDVSIQATITIDPDFFLAKSPTNSRPLFLTASPIADEESSGLLCRRCGDQILANVERYEVFEGMHWSCFHYAFEHQVADGAVDPDMACRDPSCPARAFDTEAPPAWPT